MEMLDQVMDALDYAIKYYKGKPLVPKKNSDCHITMNYNIIYETPERERF